MDRLQDCELAFDFMFIDIWTIALQTYAKFLYLEVVSVVPPALDNKRNIYCGLGGVYGDVKHIHLRGAP